MLKFGGWEGAAEDVVDGVYVFILWVNITINEISGFLPWLAIILRNFKHQQRSINQVCKEVNVQRWMYKTEGLSS